MSSLFTDFPSLGTETKEPSIPVYIPVTAEDVKLGDEFIINLNAAKELYHTASYDAAIPVAQKAQLLNSITSIINALVKGQLDLYSLEEVKEIERALIQTLKKFPAVEKAFLEEYEGKLFKADNAK